MGFIKRLVSNIDLPLVVSGFIKWFYLMGSGVIISLLIKYELENKNDLSNSLYGIIMYETFISNLTLLSRAMIFNTSIIFLQFLKALSIACKKKLKKLFIYYLIIVILFMALVQ